MSKLSQQQTSTRLAFHVRYHGRSGRNTAESGHRFSNVSFQPQSERQLERLFRSGPSQPRTFAVLPYYVRFYPKSGHRARVAEFSFSVVLSGQLAKPVSRRAPGRLHDHLTLSSARIWVYGMPQGEGAGAGVIRQWP